MTLALALVMVASLFSVAAVAGVAVWRGGKEDVGFVVSIALLLIFLIAMGALA